MKKVFLIGLGVVALVLGGWFLLRSTDLVNSGKNLSQLLVKKIADGANGKVFTSQPLRGPLEEREATLTLEGVIEQTNRRRAQNGLASLQESELLDRAAEAKVKDMFERQYFEHVSPTGEGPGELAQGAGYAYLLVGENLALGNYANDADLLQAWMDSPGHRENILKQGFQEIGAAVGRGVFEGRATWLAVQEFGTPQSLCPAPNMSTKARIDALKAELEMREKELQQRKAELDEMAKSDERYSQKAQEYNTLIEQYNTKVRELKQLIGEYNVQIDRYNICTEQFSGRSNIFLQALKA